MTRSGLWLSLLLVACGDARPVDGKRRCPSWKEDIAPQLDACKDCHASREYSDFLGGKSAALSDEIHSGLALAPTLQRWAGECELAYSSTPVHAHGLMNPGSPDFHGTKLKNSGWNFDLCRKCHGDDFAGGKSGASCLTCHKNGPTACTTCHGQPPSTGAHLAHMNSPTLEKPVACATCHPIPTDFGAPGHLDGVVQLKPAFDSSTATCSGVSCHSNVTTPSWRDGKLICGGCHTLPPSTHPESRCVSCHPKVVDLDKNLVDKQRHLDGKVSIGDESGDQCLACHRVLPGAHNAHLAALHKISKPLDCAKCHTVPSTVLAPKHGNGVAEILGDCNKCHGTTPKWTDPPVYCGSCHGIPPATPVHAGATFSTCYTCHPSTMTAMGTLLPDAHVNGVVDAQ